ncbi:MAG: NAD(P)H-hydrate epimerase [Halobaculum sp.]
MAEWFQTDGGQRVRAVTADEMRAVDRVAVEEVGLRLLQMMENAGRALAWHVRAVADGPVAVLAGNGGNGGGGMVCARHLANRDVSVRVVLDRDPEDLTDAAAHQFGILDAMDVPYRVADGDDLLGTLDPAAVVDAFVGYGLRGALRSPADGLVAATNDLDAAVVSLDVPSGIDATTGERDGPAVEPDRTVTLALPKTGLDVDTGKLFLADIGIPAVFYEELNIEYDSPFGEEDWVALRE